MQRIEEIDNSNLLVPAEPPSVSVTVRENNSKLPANSFNRNMLIAKSVLTGLSIPAGYLYVNYSRLCVQNEGCVKPISFIPGENAKIGLLVFSGGGGFSASAAALGLLAAPMIHQTYVNLSPAAKRTFVGYCVVYASLQSFNIVLNEMGSLGPHDKLSDPSVYWSLIPSAAAIVPTAFFNAAIFFPYVLSGYNYIHAKLTESPEGFNQHKLNREQFNQFKKDVKKRWKIVSSHAHQLQKANRLNSEELNRLVFLGAGDLVAINQSPLKQGARFVGYGAGLIGGGTFLFGSTGNTFIQAGHLMPAGPQVILTIILGLVSAPSYLKLPMEFFSTLLSGGNEDSLPLQFFPRSTVLISALTVAWQMASYSAVVMSLFHLLETSSNAVLSLGMAGIISYHSEAIISLILSKLSRFSADKGIKAIFEFEKQIKELFRMTYEQYIISNKLSPAKTAPLSLQITLENPPEETKAEKTGAEKDVEAQLFPARNSSASLAKSDSYQINNLPKPERWSQKWCCWFSCGRKYAPDVDVLVDVAYDKLNASAAPSPK